MQRGVVERRVGVKGGKVDCRSGEVGREAGQEWRRERSDRLGEEVEGEMEGLEVEWREEWKARR